MSIIVAEGIRLVGLQELAELLGVQYGTTTRWRARGVLPDPDFTISQTPIWKEATILRWAKETGRMTDEGTNKLAARPKTTD